VNGQIVNGEISNLYLTNTTLAVKEFINYYPGELIIEDSIYQSLVADSLNFNLHFDYNTFTVHEHLIRNFECELNIKLFHYPYLIIDFFDFNDPDYKAKYEDYTDKDFLVQFTFPESGIWIPKVNEKKERIKQ
tara:strand:- start:46 stop:444 length:399 start_codon:yes stop_codon:yes gene_type:complete